MSVELEVETVQVKITFPAESFIVNISEEEAENLEEDASLAGDILDAYLSDAQHDWDWDWVVEAQPEATDNVVDDLTNLSQYDRLIRSLIIFKKYENQDADSYIYAEHDVLYGITEEMLSAEDKAVLFTLGWHSGDGDSIEFFV